jgi:pimeloyl-ACP methyl ester carboxylesterase
VQPEPFEVHIPDEDLEDLHDRLARTRWPTDVGNADWRYGVERGWLEDLVAYWRDNYDWRATERIINRLPQYRVEIDGFPLHFVHIRSGRPGATPLLLIHGWPWTFLDFHELIGLLAPAFDLVVPSLPGFGFSSPLERTGLGVPSLAEVFGTLLRDILGHERYGVAGGDFGAVIALQLARARPKEVIGVFTTTPVFPGLDVLRLRPDEFASDERWMVDRIAETRRSVASHFVVHTHDPQTLAYALADSPVGTSAWLWERRRAWSDCDGDLLRVHDRDFLCALASIYWLTGTIGSSMRLYFDNHGVAPSTASGRRTGGRVVDVPAGFAIHPKEVMLVPRAVVAAATDLRRWTVMPRGGHFGFSEQPEALAGELSAFFGDLGSTVAHGATVG